MSHTIKAHHGAARESQNCPPMTQQRFGFHRILIKMIASFASKLIIDMGWI